jgi:diguanylate cyclase (GGDEF)-like protein
MADFLDYRTLAIVLAAKCLFQAIGLGYVWYANRKFSPARDWALGWLLVAGGTFLVASQPDATSSVTIVFRICLIYIGLLTIASGLIRACGGRTPWRLFSAMLVVALSGDLWYSLVEPSLSARIVIFSAFLVLGDIYVAIVAFRAPRGPLRGTQRLIAILLLLQATAACVRGIASSRMEFAPLLQPTPAQMLFFLAAIASAFLFALLLAVLTSQHTNALLTATIDNLNQGVAMFDAQQKLIICNEEYGQLYGLSADHVKPGTPLDAIIRARIDKGVFSGISPDEYFRERTAPVTTASASLHALNDGRSIAVSRRPMAGGGWVTTHENVTAHRRIESQLAYMAHHDALTGLVNRLVFLERMGAGLERQRSDGEDVCLILLDLDRFKAVNDSLGHPTGDALLKAVAGRLLAWARSTDTVARLGGDEFAIVRTGFSARRDAIDEFVQRLLLVIAAPYDLNGRKATIGVSIGVAFAPRDAADCDGLMQKADLALYRSKSEGRNNYRFYETDMDAKARAHLALERALRNVDAAEDLVLRYQPFVAARTAAVCGAAASVFWRGPDAEPIEPSELMQVAEAAGFAAGLGAWMLKHGCAAAAAWPCPVKLALDLSPAQFAEGTLADVIDQALAASALPATRLMLRVTEACFAEDAALRLALLHALKARGVTVTLADFGGGTASLKQLLAFPYDHVSIGKTFVADIARDANCATIVAALTGFASSLGVTTIAEDVATSEQFALLQAAGCGQFRGSLFGPPRAASHLTAVALETLVA